jgi:ATP-binding cassette, subfamily C (CFTR/MRP), member 4
MDNIFKGEMAGKTRIMVTHKIKLLEEVDRVILIKDGMIVA